MNTARVPLIAIGGLSVGKEAYPELIELGKLENVVLFTNPKGTTIREKTNRIIAQLPKSFEEADIVSFSQGSLVATKIACHLKTPRRLILVNPAGLIDDDSPTALIGRFFLQVAEEIRYAIRHAFHLDFKPLRNSALVGLNFLKNCFCKIYLWQELSEMAHAKVVPSLRDLKERGVKIVLLTAKSDRIFPEKRIAQTLEGEPGLIDEWIHFPGEDASHNASYLKEIGIIRRVLGW
ncbi:MAG: hypothetical protein PHE52_01200 [Candidatus Pacebacteria bacterium]|nr:hypothetical protein [Candidatus Paceibacterota bacterium]